jgi:hypothetical protein
LKSQDQGGSVALTSNLVLSANAWHGGVVDSATPAAPLLLGRIGRALSARPSRRVTMRSRIFQGQTMPKRDKMEIKIAFWALVLFAAFMAAGSLTAYFQKK